MPAPASPLTDSRQLVRVLAADWNSPHAVLQRYTRTQAAAAWQPVGDALPVMLGRAGLAWGRGLHPESANQGRIKSEGNRVNFKLDSLWRFYNDPAHEWMLKA